MACSVAGITSDANVLTNELRLIAQRSVLQEAQLTTFIDFVDFFFFFSILCNPYWQIESQQRVFPVLSFYFQMVQLKSFKMIHTISLLKFEDLSRRWQQARFVQELWFETHFTYNFSKYAMTAVFHFSSGIYCSTRNQYHVSSWWRLCVTSSKPTHNLEVWSHLLHVAGGVQSESTCCGAHLCCLFSQVRDHSVSLCSTSVGTNTTGSSCTRVTPAATMEAGKQPALATTVL